VGNSFRIGQEEVSRNAENEGRHERGEGSYADKMAKKKGENVQLRGFLPGYGGAIPLA